MEISSYAQEDEGRFAARTLSDISIASNASGKAQNVSGFGAPKHVRDIRVKFLCSHGGKILPRPSDKRLRYVGGETRMISVPRHIQLIALRLKLAEIYGHEVTFKYQLPEEDLDALVSVSSDEDLENMMEECDRLDVMEGSSRLRVFVFSSLDQDAIDFNDVADPKLFEHRYVEAVNTIQMDVSSRENDNVVTPELYKTYSGLHPNYVWNTAVMQERFPLPSENFHPQVYPLEQFTAVGSYPLPMLPQRNNVLSHIAPPLRITVTKQGNELASSLHANNIHGPPVAFDDFLDLESGESASSSASSQHDLYHRSRWNSNSQVQSHSEHIAYRIDEDQMFQAESGGQVEAPIDSKVHKTFAAPFLPTSEHIYGLDSTTEDKTPVRVFQAESRGQGETPIEGKVHATFAAPFLPTSEQVYSLDTTTEDQNPVQEDQPLSPGALLQRQLQAGQNHLEANNSKTFGKQGSQSSLDGKSWQPTQAYQLLDERQQIEQLPFHHPIIQEGLLADGGLLSEPLNIPGKIHPLSQIPCLPLFLASNSSTPLVQSEVAGKPVVVLQQVKLQEASLYSAVHPDVDYTRSFCKNDGGGNLSVVAGLVRQPVAENPLLSGLQTNTVDINKKDELDGLNSHVIPSTNVSEEQSAITGLESGIGSQTSWLASNLVSFPSKENSQVDMLDQIKQQTKASGVTANQLVGAGPSLLDGLVDYNDKLFSAAVSDVKVDLASAAMRDCSNIDLMSDFLLSAPLINCCTPPTDTLVGTLLDPLAKLGKEEIGLPIVADALSRISLDRASEDIRLGFLHGADSVKQPVYLDNAVCCRTDDAKTNICKKGTVDVIVDEEGTPVNEAEHFSSTLRKESQSIVGPLEHEQILHVKYEQDAVELESSLVMERDLTIESSRLEVEEEDVFSSTVDGPMNAAAVAEAEAIARGLQTIRNFDLEELRELGSGTFGTVYHGKWRGTDVAIKRIKSSCFTGRPSERERLIADFWQEAFILGQLHHPNVVAFYGVVPDGPDGTLATVTEYMVNGSLKQALQKKDRNLDRRKRLIIAMDAAFGMEYLHKKNVVHFDLKCENLLVNLRDIQRPICKVGDLGLSKVKQQTMISGGVRGTLPWMAPELLNGSSSLVSEKVDVFSFGIVLWELLTGEEPYASMHYGAIIGGIVTNTLRPLVPKWCDAAWKSLMEACWAADPAERPTFTEIANSLRAMEVTINAKGQGQAQNVE